MIFIALGANLASVYGDPPQTLAAAVQSISDSGIEVIKASRLFRTAPVPISDQPYFYNCVISVQTNLSPQDLLKTLHAIEHDFGRVRKQQNEARILDLDIIAYNNLIIDDDTIKIPHPRAHQRGFVLYPLFDIAPDWIHPVLQQPLKALVANLDETHNAEALDIKYAG